MGDACSDHVGWFRLYKPVVVSHDMVSFIQACSCVDVTFEITAKDNDKDDLYSPFFQ